MKILFLDITRKYIRVRGTNFRLPTAWLISGVVSFLGSRSAVAEPSSTSKAVCTIPEGPYLSTCRYVTSILYKSTDPAVPPTCNVTALCETAYVGLPPVWDTVFVQQHPKLQNIHNRNGTLVKREVSSKDILNDACGVELHDPLRTSREKSEQGRIDYDSHKCTVTGGKHPPLPEPSAIRRGISEDYDYIMHNKYSDSFPYHSSDPKLHGKAQLYKTGVRRTIYNARTDQPMGTDEYNLIHYSHHPGYSGTNDCPSDATVIPVDRSCSASGASAPVPDFAYSTYRF